LTFVFHELAARRLANVKPTPLALQILIEDARGGRIAPPLGKSDDPENADGAIEPDGDDVASLHGMPRRPLPHAIDAHMAAFHERGRAGAGFD
jgi:hypothetical protein